MDVEQELLKLVETSARTETKVDSLCELFDTLMPHLVKMNERVSDLEKNRSWMKGAAWVLGGLWAGLLALLGLAARHR